MKRSLIKLEQISQTLSSHQTHYTFNKIDDHLSLKYRNGRVNASKWLNELIYFYIQKEKNFINEFKEQIQLQKKSLSDLNDGDFKQGLFDELNIIEEMLDDNRDN
jgi:hypothetical protein